MTPASTGTRWWAGAMIVSLTLLGCGGASEQLLLQRFFSASHLRDRTALARFSTTIFEPRVDGIVDRFRVLDVSADEPVALEGANVSTPSADLVARLSLDDPINPMSPGPATPALLRRTVSIEAQLRRPDGERLTRRMNVVLMKAILAEPRREGRWIVTSFE